MPTIDTHAHIFPADFGPPPAGCDPAVWPSVQPGQDPGISLLVNGPMRFPAKKVWFDAEARLEASAASGLDAELLSPFPALLTSRPPAKTGRDLCRVTNEYIAGLVAAYPAAFYGLGTIPLQDPELAAAELTELGKGGLRARPKQRGGVAPRALFGRFRGGVGAARHRRLHPRPAGPVGPGAWRR